MIDRGRQETGLEREKRDEREERGGEGRREKLGNVLLTSHLRDTRAVM